MSGMWKRSHGRTSEAPPDERGGYRYVRPTATAPHLNSTHQRRSRPGAARPVFWRTPDHADAVMARLEVPQTGRSQRLMGPAAHAPKLTYSVMVGEAVTAKSTGRSLLALVCLGLAAGAQRSHYGLISVNHLDRVSCCRTGATGVMHAGRISGERIGSRRTCMPWIGPRCILPIGRYDPLVFSAAC